MRTVLGLFLLSLPFMALFGMIVYGFGWIELLKILGATALVGACFIGAGKLLL